MENKFRGFFFVLSLNVQTCELVSCVCPYEAAILRSRASNSQVSMRVRPEKKLEKEGRENLDSVCVFGKKRRPTLFTTNGCLAKNVHIFTVSS